MAGSARASGRNRVRADTLAKELTSQDMGSRMVHQDIEQCSLFSDVGPEHDVTYRSHGNNADGRKDA